jgi:hypothetical protein
MRDETHSALDGHTVERLGQAQDRKRQFQWDRSPRSMVPNLGTVAGTPEAISPYQTLQIPSPLPHEAISFPNVSRHTTRTPKVAQPPPLPTTQMYNSSVPTSHPYTGPANNLRSLSPYREVTNVPPPRRPYSPLGSDILRPFQRLDISGKEKKGSRMSIAFKSGKILRSQSSSGGTHQSCYYECYRIEKLGDDWMVAERIQLKATQDELEKRVAKSKSRITVLDKMIAMSALRRAQINRLLDEKNYAERHKDAEWVPVLIETTKHRGIGVLVFEVVIAKSSTPQKSVLFVSEKSDVRVPIRSKDWAADRERRHKSHNQDLFENRTLFIGSGTPIADVGPLHTREKRLHPFGLQRLFAKNGRPIDDRRLGDVEAQNINHLDSEIQFTKDYKPKKDQAPIVKSRLFDSGEKKFDSFEDETLCRSDHRSPSIAYGPIPYDIKSADMGNGQSDSMQQRFELNNFVSEIHAAGSISEPQPVRPQLTSQAGIRDDLYPFQEDHDPTAVTSPDHIDKGGPFGISSTVQPSLPDSAYYSASDIMSSRCDSVSPVAFRTNEPLSPLQPDRAVDEDRRANCMSAPHRNYVPDLVGLRRPSVLTSAMTRKTRTYPDPFSCHLCHRRFPRANSLRSHLLMHTEEQLLVCMTCGQAFARPRDRVLHEELHNGDKSVSETVRDPNSKEGIDERYRLESEVCSAVPRSEGAMAMPLVAQAAGNEGHTFKKLETANAETLFSIPVAPAAPLFLVQNGLQLPLKTSDDSSFHSASPKHKTDCNIAITEANEMAGEQTQDCVYYCSIRGCRYSANPDFRDLDPRIANKIHDSENHKVYLLKGLSRVDLEAHMRKAHDIASKELEVRQPSDR